MQLRFLSSMLVFAIVTVGLPPCVGMDMPGAGMAEHCCEGAECPDALGAAGHHQTPTPGPDCCALGQAPDTRTPAERVARVTNHALLAPAVAPPLPVTALASQTRRSDVGPPGPAVPIHLLHGVFLI